MAGPALGSKRQRMVLEALLLALRLVKAVAKPARAAAPRKALVPALAAGPGWPRRPRPWRA